MENDESKLRVTLEERIKTAVDRYYRSQAAGKVGRQRYRGADKGQRESLVNRTVPPTCMTALKIFETPSNRIQTHLNALRERGCLQGLERAGSCNPCDYHSQNVRANSQK